MLALVFTAALAVPPFPAAKFAAAAFDVPTRDLVRIAMRESQGRRIGVHFPDRWASKTVCIQARNRDLVPHDACRDHLGGWSTRGAFGLMAAYNLKWVGLDRWPWVLDIPLVSAIAAARRYRALCPRDGWCPG